MDMINGYVFLDLTKSNVYQKALKVLESGKPVVVKDGSGAPYYVDSMNLIGTMIVITKGGRTITINDLNIITSVGDIQEKTYYYNFELSNIDIAGDYLEGYCILVSKKKLTTANKLPIGLYFLIGSPTQANLSNNIPLYIEKASNEMNIIDTNNNSTTFIFDNDFDFNELNF